MENVKWFVNQGVAVAALAALLWIEFKRSGGLSKLPGRIEKLEKTVKELTEIIKNSTKKK